MLMGALKEDGNPVNTPVIRIQLPWPFIFACLGALTAILIVMWASVNRLTEKVGELETTMRTGNGIIAALQNDVNLLKYRQEVTERRIQNTPK
jgi:predicted DNA-binding ArsR family transcriptional regulator